MGEGCGATGDRRDMDYGCAAGLEDRTARGERVGLLGGREVHDVVEEGCAAGQERGGRPLRCWFGEKFMDEARS